MYSVKNRPYFKFKNSKGIEYGVFFRKPNERIHGYSDGVCEDPKYPDPKIEISPYLTKKTELNTSIHEICHAFFWDKSEAEVTKFANTVTKFLYTKCGWRKMEAKKNEPRRKK